MAYVLGLLIGLLILQAIIVGLFGVETNRHSLEELAPAPVVWRRKDGLIMTKLLENSACPAAQR